MMVAKKKSDAKKKTVPKSKMVGFRIPTEMRADIDSLASAWNLSPGQVLGRMVRMGYEAAVKEPVINPRIVLLASNYSKLVGENKIKADVLLSMVENQIKEMLSSQG